MLLTLIQPRKIKALKISYYVPHCANKYVKEKEKTKEKEKKKETKTTIFTKITTWGVTNDNEQLFI